MVEPIQRYERAAIIQEVSDAYWEHRKAYGAPRTQQATLEMFDEVLDGILSRLSCWETNENNAQAALSRIREIIKETP